MSKGATLKNPAPDKQKRHISSEGKLSFPQILYRRRLEIGLSQEKLAEQMQVSKITIHRWEHGETIPFPYHRQRLCSYLEMPSAQLFPDNPDDLSTTKLTASQSVSKGEVVASEELDRLPDNQLEDTIKHLRDRGYKVTEEYSGDTPEQPSKASKVSLERPLRKTWWDWLQLLIIPLLERPPRKTWWDWLQLLIIPLLIAGLGIGFTWVQNQTRLQIANNQQQEITLQTYLDNMSDLLLNKNSKSKPGEAVSELARERTLTTLRRLDANRNKIVLRFLQDAHLIGIQDAVINLSDADLSNDDLSGVNLSGTDLSNANLKGANLNDANLNGAILNGATMNGATLSDATLSNAFLNSADLSNAYLSNADLSGTDLRYASLSNAILNGATLNGAIMNGVDLSNAILNSAILSGVILSGADLNDADLSNAHLGYAILNGATLSGVRNLTQQQLDEVYSCTNAILSTGFTCHRNQ